MPGEKIKTIDAIVGCDDMTDNQDNWCDHQVQNVLIRQGARDVALFVKSD